MINVLKLKARLKEKDMTQEEVANRLGMNPSTFNKKVNDEVGEYLTIDEAERLKSILEIPDNEVLLYFFTS